MKTDKQIISQAFFPAVLSVVASEAISAGNDFYFKKTTDVLDGLFAGKDRAKLMRRALREAVVVIKELQDAQSNKISGHKLILVIYELAQKVLDNHFALQPQVIELLGEFLEIEAKQDTTIDGKKINDEDWLAVKKSAEKQAERIFGKIAHLF